MSEEETVEPQMDTEEDVLAAEPAEAEVKKEYRLDILATIKTAQQQNGLRHNDYERYRQYCGRRLRRVRKTLKWLGPHKGFRKKILEPKHVTDARFLTIPLMNAERAWSYAMQLKSDREERKDDSSRKKHHMIKRLGKAASLSKELRDLCSAKADPTTQLEADAYSSWMFGNWLLERDLHADALQKFTHAKKVYENLGKLEAMSELCQERIKTIDPYLRFCHHEIERQKRRGQDGADNSLLSDVGDGVDEALASKLSFIMSQGRASEAKTLDAVPWRGKNISIVNESLRVKILEAKDIISRLESGAWKSKEHDDAKESEDHVTLFQNLFSAFDTALQIVRHDLSDSMIERTKKDDLQSLKSYLSFSKLKYIVERNLSLAAELSDKYRDRALPSDTKAPRKQIKPEEIANVFEKLMQNMTDIAELGPSELTPQLIAARLATYKATRVYYLAEAYAFGKDKDFGKAYLLYKRTQDLCKQALDALKAVSDEKDASRLKQIQESATAQLALVHAEGLLDSMKKDNDVRQKVSEMKIDDVKAETTLKPLVDRLDEYESGKPEQFHSLVSLPPDFLPVPCKPILFDLAFNTLEFPDVSSRIKAKAPAPSSAPAPAVPIIRSQPPAKKHHPEEKKPENKPKAAELKKEEPKPAVKSEEPQKKGGVAGAIGAVGGAVGGMLGKLWGRGNQQQNQ